MFLVRARRVLSGLVHSKTTHKHNANANVASLAQHCKANSAALLLAGMSFICVPLFVKKAGHCGVCVCVMMVDMVSRPARVNIKCWDGPRSRGASSNIAWPIDE